MSIHSSLRSAGGHTAHRNVLKRHERVKILQDQGRWKPGDPVLGIAKVKNIKIKVKKEAKVAAEGAAATAAGQPAAAAPAATTAKKAPEKEKKAAK